VCGRLAHVGARLRAAVASALDDAGANGVCVAGLDPMFFLRFADGPTASGEGRETRFLTAARDAGVLFKRGAVGVKLSASRRADDRLLDPVAAEAGRRGLPVLHHVWQWRRRDWPMQEASDAVELARLARRHPDTQFLLAHIGGGGEYMHTFPAVADLPNVHLDLSGSGVDRGMLDAALAAVGARRLVWACDVTMCTGLAKLRALDHVGLSAEDLADVRWRNAARLFPAGAFGSLHAAAAGHRGSDGGPA